MLRLHLMDCRTHMYDIYVVWCRRTDELVDGPNAFHITPSALDRWESRLENLFSGHPYDKFDAALSDTISKFPVDIQACCSQQKWINLYFFVMYSPCCLRLSNKYCLLVPTHGI